jgi:aspartate carbamoyltransferase regulatory subunit
MIEFKDLQLSNKQKVIDYITENIYLVRKEEIHLTIPIVWDTDNENTIELNESEAEYVITKESKKYGYWCDVCEKYVLGDTIEDLLEHAIKDLKL